MSSAPSAGSSPVRAKPTPPTDPPATPPRRPRWNWDDLFPLGVLALLLAMPAAILLWPYFWGRYDSGDIGMCLVGAFMIAVAVSFVVCVVRLVQFWRRLGLLSRLLRSLPLALAVLLFVPSSPINFGVLRPSIRALLPDDLTAYLYGFRDRMSAMADWRAIRQWAKETRARRAKGDSTPLEWPPCIKSLDPCLVTLAPEAVIIGCSVTWASINPPTFASLIVFADETGELNSRPDAHRIAPGVWVAYWQPYGCRPEEDP